MYVLSSLVNFRSFVLKKGRQHGLSKTAKELTTLLGGKENVISATHCATRLRLVMKDEALIDKDAIEELEGVKGAFSSSGQFQIIFGTGSVNKVYELLRVRRVLRQTTRIKTSQP